MLLKSPNPSQKKVSVAGTVFNRAKHGLFEVPNETCVIEPLLELGFVEAEPEPTPGSITVARDDVKSAEFHATVIRCTCPEGQGAINHPGVPCPKGTVVQLGKIAAYYRNPFRRLIHNLSKFFRR